jgi:ribonuclease HI
MELTALNGALKVLKEPCAIMIVTDSQYIEKAINQYLQAWKRNSWRKPTGKLVSNADLWIEYTGLASRHRITCKWISGNSNDADKLRCKALAREAAREQIASRGVSVRRSVQEATSLASLAAGGQKSSPVEDRVWTR